MDGLWLRTKRESRNPSWVLQWALRCLHSYLEVLGNNVKTRASQRSVLAFSMFHYLPELTFGLQGILFAPLVSHEKERHSNYSFFFPTCVLNMSQQVPYEVIQLKKDQCPGMETILHWKLNSELPVSMDLTLGQISNFSISVSLSKSSMKVQTTWEFVKEIYSTNINNFYFKKPVSVHTFYDRIRHHNEIFINKTSKHPHYILN